MGQRQTYVKGGGTHRFVPPPLDSKVSLYRTSKKIVDSGSQLHSRNTLARPSTSFHHRGHKRLENDMTRISDEGYDTIKYEIKKFSVPNKIDMSIV